MKSAETYCGVLSQASQSIFAVFAVFVMATGMSMLAVSSAGPRASCTGFLFVTPRTRMYSHSHIRIHSPIYTRIDQKHSTGKSCCKRFGGDSRIENEVSMSSSFRTRRDRSDTTTNHCIGSIPTRLHSLNNKDSGSTGTSPSNSLTASVRLKALTEDDTEEVAQIVAFDIFSRPSPLRARCGGGMVVFLQGDLGVGKTSFARGFLRAATGNWALRVTSPTYLLSNTYPVILDRTETGSDNVALDIHHIDLYRLSGIQTQTHELAPLNLNHVFASCLSLIEWPSRLPESLVPPNRLEITIAMPIGGLDDAHVHDDEKGDIMEDVQGRMLTLTSFGEAWGEWLQELLKEGYVDDLIVE